MTTSNLIPPQTLWAQDRQKIFVTVNLLDSKDHQIETGESKLSFSATADSKNYGFDLELFGKVDPKSWHQVITNRSVAFTASKANPEEPFWTRLQKPSGKFSWIKTDFSKFVDEDADEDEVPSNGMNMNDQMMNMFGGGMGGLPGMPDMSALGGAGDMKFDTFDSDDEDLPETEEVAESE